MNTSLKGKVAIITGGNGNLGREYSKALKAAGAKVAVLDLKNSPPNPNARFYKTDITKKKEVEATLAKIEKDLGIPEILINNAALDFPPNLSGEKETFENYPLEKWNAVLDVNLTGAFICAQVFGSRMAKNGGGSIINISSIYGLVSPDQRIYKNFVKPVSYTVTKAGILGLTKYLATYWADKGVRVNSFTLGGVFNNQDKDFVVKYSQRTPLGRMAKKDEYNEAILFLASDTSSYMTGANLVIDGGWTAW